MSCVCVSCRALPLTVDGPITHDDGPCIFVAPCQVGANANDDRAEEAVRRSQGSNPALDIAFRRGGEAMEGSGAPAGVGDAAGLGTVAAGQ